MSSSDLVLITGGAGFIGSHIADALLAKGYRVRILDVLHEQVHGDTQRFPDYLAREVETLHGDIRDSRTVQRALKGVSGVFHFAAAVGVGQSMYEIERYTDINNRGTAVLLEALMQRPIRKLVVASSMSLYGEGQYRNEAGNTVSPATRTAEQLRLADWDLRDADGRPLEPIPTSEDKIPAPQSIYALSKLDQEVMSLLVGRAYRIPVIALRFFNVYGVRQALSNPYTGVLANFASRYLNGNPPIIFEDGLQRRDFVHVRDLSQACLLALETDTATDMALNIGSGNSYSILEIAKRLGLVLSCTHIAPQVSQRYRTGDIRNCFADISRAKRALGYSPSVVFDAGLRELAEWLAETASEDRGELAVNELRRRGLVA